MKKFYQFLVRFPLIFGGFFLFYTGAYGQGFKIVEQTNSHSGHTHAPGERCGQKVLETLIQKEMGVFGSPEFFENWMDQKIEQKRLAPSSLRTQNEPRLIPVVVHVIHSGSPLGSGTNIPESQILEQIRILNEDFRRTNADTVNTPLEFRPVAADANIEFVLAKQDPNGLPTNGIVRVQGPKNTYSPDDGVLIGQISQWNPEEYLNIWVVPLVQPFIGYASFPISDLPGLNFSPVPAITDGVTIDYRFFGRGGSATSASLGRTATHEVGHYLGLRHIWGDGGCEVDDFVTDTPLQDNSNSVCNANLSRFSCGVSNMVQNYMDYTPDACMNIFTRGQVERFDVVLANSPRRVGLVNNRATQEPQLLDLDLAVTKVIEPGEAICDPLISPTIEVINGGSSNINSARIAFRINNQVIETRRFNLNLATGESAIVSFTDYLAPLTENQYTFEILQVNDQTDQNPDNNQRSSTPSFQGEIDLPYTYPSGTFPAGWIVSNPDQSLTWESTSVTLGGQAQPAIYIRHYEYEGPGQLDYFISPQIDLTQYPNAQLVFEVAHAPYNQPGFQDELVVAIGEACLDNFDLVNPPYQKQGTRLETSTPTLQEFVPTSNQQFRTEIVNLKSFSSLGSVRVAFVTKNSYGNNIYIKNIRILPQEEFKYELQIESVSSPTAINAGTHETEIVQIRNTGNLPVSKFLFLRSTNNGSNQTFLASGTTLSPDEIIDLELNNSTSEGKNKLQYSISEPNFDQNGNSGEVFEQYNVESTETIEVPWRQRFNPSSALSPWLAISPEEDNTSWEIIPNSTAGTSDNIARLQNQENGKSYWLGSPLFNLQRNSQASVFFDLAAGQVNPNSSLTLLASQDGGETYEEVWNAVGTELSTVSSGSANAANPGDFRRIYASLSSFTGNGANAVRLAFVFNSNGPGDTPVYLDNIELFLRDDPNPVIPQEGRSVVFPNPANGFFNIAFNLAQRENLTIRIISSTGQLVHEDSFPNTLNQTYTFSTELFRNGLYIVQITGPSVNEIKKLFIN